MGRRKKIVEECERLMDKPSQIRNIAIAAHIDHGKCVTGDARIVLADGRVTTAADLYDRIKRTGRPTTDTPGEAYHPGENVDVVALDRSTAETVHAPIEYAVKREADEPLVQVTTSNGHHLATTPEHRYLVLTDHGVLEFEPASDLDPGDVIVGVRHTPVTPATPTRVGLLGRLARHHGLAASLNDDTRATLAGHLDDAAWIPLPDLLAAAESAGLDLPLVYDGITRLTTTSTGPEGPQAEYAITLPDDPAVFFYLAATLAHHHDDDPALADAIREAATVLGPNALTARNPPSPGPTLQRLLDTAFGVFDEPGIPGIVHTSDQPAAAAYVRGLLDATAHVDTDPPAVVIRHPAPRVLADLHLLLYRFDVASTRTDDALRIVGGLSLQHTHDLGLTHPEKHAGLADLTRDPPPATVDAVPINPGTLRDIRTSLNLTPEDITPEYAAYETGDIPLTKPALRRITDRFTQLAHPDTPDPRTTRLANLAKADTSFVTITDTTTITRDTVYDFGVHEHHNFVTEGLIVHNTTLTDNLLAGAGMISKDLAGQQLAMDTEEDEQERGITIDAANVSMTHEYQGTGYLINLIDTPGHVDFGGDVTRAMRAVDGALVVVDAVEGAMPQTETVLRQALREDVKPVLFINKVDRLINELREGPEEMQERLQRVIRSVNELIRGIAPERYEENGWQVSVQDGSVAFGSALYNWAISVPFMQETGMDFTDIYDHNRNENIEPLRENLPLSDVVLNVVAEHFPDPVESQPRRIPRIWRGDPDSEIARQMAEVDDDGEVVLMVTDISLDPHAGEIATGRLFSGTIERGQDLYVSGVAGTNRVQSVGIFMGGEREEVERVPAGNIAAVTGLTDAIAGSTVSSIEMTAFETIEHISEPVITKSIEAQTMDDLPKLIEVLQQVSKEDPTLYVEINEDTGEHLISGQGELHLEVITQRIERNQGIPVRTGEPIVVYREAPTSPSREVEGVSPNRHNRFYIHVEPLPDEIVEKIKLGEINMDTPELERREALIDAGLDKDTAENIIEIFGPNLIADDTRGIQYLNETMELVLEGFEDALKEGPLAREPVQGALVRLVDARLHEDAIHRGPAQVIPAIREALHRALIDATIALLEPMQQVRIDVPAEHMGAASGEIQGRRGRVDDMYQEGNQMVIEGIAPVAEMIGFSSDIRSATEGRASWNTENAGFERLADNIQTEIILEIRERKGRKTELPEGVDYF